MTENDTKQENAERIAKRLARAGVASRREAEKLIEQRRITVDGETITSAALNVTPDQRIEFDGELVGTAEATRVWMYHKPAGVLTTNKDPQGRPTVFEKLPRDMPRVMTVGRLDFNTEGLLLLTNDGELARHLELPKNAWIRRYHVRVHGRVHPKQCAALAKGVTIDRVYYDSVKIEVEETKETGANSWMTVSIKEGKNREIRKIMAYLGLDVTRLIRISFGPFVLGKMPRGAVTEIEHAVLKESLGGVIKGDAPKRTPKAEQLKPKAKPNARPTTKKKAPLHKKKSTATNKASKLSERVEARVKQAESKKLAPAKKTFIKKAAGKK